MRLDGRYVNLLREMTATLFKLKDQSTFFGFSWSFLHPLIVLGVLFTFFRFRLGRDIPHYEVYLLIGIIHYTHFANTTNSAMHVLVNMRQLTRNAIFPKEILVVSSVFSNAVEFLISLCICVIIAALSGVRLTSALVLLPLVFMLQLMFVLGLSFLLSCLYLFVRDVGHIFQVFLRLLFLITPIFYTIDFLGGGLASSLVRLNPLTQLMNLSRAVILEGSLAPMDVVVILLLFNVVLIHVGLRLFKGYEPAFAETA
jgi:lipopolysaccharide transport system permease protein